MNEFSSRLIRARWATPKVARPSPYLSLEWRCKFAVETQISCNASAIEQMIELELMLEEE